MSDITETQPGRAILAIDILLGTALFRGCWPTEPISSYVFRSNKARWIAFLDYVFGEGHCAESFRKSKSHLFDAPEYR